MTSPSISDVHPLVRKLESIFPLADDEKAAILSISVQVTDIRADQDVVRAGDAPSRSFFVIEGVTGTYVPLSSGNRQIVAFCVAGDTPDLQSLHLDVLDNGVSTLTPCKVGFISHSVLRDLCSRFPRIASALWRSTLIDASIVRAWTASIGQRDGYSRMAHLLCEFMVRNRAVGLARGQSCDFPITQRELGDALDMTSVHVNRVVKALKADGHVALGNGLLTIPNWEQLVKVGDFDATYLHLNYKQAAA